MRIEDGVPEARPGQGRGTVFLALVGVVALVACVIPWTPSMQTDRHRVEDVDGAGARIGTEKCYACHDSFSAHVVATEYHANCEGCHGPGQLHDYTAKPQDIRFPANADCETCHEPGRHTLRGWSSSKHARAEVLCSDCHDTHNREPRHVRLAGRLGQELLSDASDTTRLCSSCHPEVAAQFDLPSHHPIGEGMLGCTDCHRPHQSRKQTLGARTQLCASCHQEVTGPWIHEHPPVNEDCRYCHTPHGASADNLLEVNQPGGCVSCHSLATAGAAHDPWAFTTRCTDCHSAVHGSYTDSHLRR